MSIIGLIERKRDAGRLTPDEIQWIITEYTADRIPDYQMSSLLMAIFKEGLDRTELAAWTEAMLHSGDTLDFSHIAAAKVDKHSTGGVGDKVSIPLAPMVAACGVAVPMMSGRGLGHTGGTLDKLETIPGFRTALDPSEFTSILEQTGIVLAGQSESLVPADRRIYALRDASGTVPSIPLIASSIMSKKLAEGLDALVLDVKTGQGAFMKDFERARVLAETMVDIGRAHGTVVTGIITDMSQPLGRQVGNANEIAESVEVLVGGGPPDLLDVTFRLGEEMLLLAGITATAEEARLRLEKTITSGSAFEKLIEVAVAQGGDPAVLENPALLARAPEEAVLSAPGSGYLSRADALAIGIAATRLGAGRERKDDEIDPGVGITVMAKIGDPVQRGEPLARIAWSDRGRFERAFALLEGAFAISDEPVEPPQLIQGEVR